jgi:hypothetical protein
MWEKSAVIGAKGVLEGLSAVFAFGAVIFWFLSARVGMPVVVLTWGEIKNLEQFYEAIKRAAALNRTAATCAGIASHRAADGVKFMNYTQKEGWETTPRGDAAKRLAEQLRQAGDVDPG